MNWQTHGDTTSLLVYDTVYQLCNYFKLPVFHVTMLTEPLNKEIVFGKNDAYRYGSQNQQLVNVMERSLLYMDNLSLAQKRDRRERFKEAKYNHSRTLHEFKMNPKLRNEKFKDIKHNNDKNKRYCPFFPGAKISGKTIPALAEQEKMIPEVATYFKRSGIEMKMIFRNNYVGRNIIPLKDIKYFESENRKLYFDSVANILKKGRKAQIVLVEPDTGIADHATTDVKKTRKSYIYADEISQLQYATSEDSIIAVKHSFQSSLRVPDKSPIYSTIAIDSIRFGDKSTRTGIVLFFRNKEMKKLTSTFFQQHFQGDVHIQ